MLQAVLREATHATHATDTREYQENKRDTQDTREKAARQTRHKSPLDAGMRRLLLSAVLSMLAIAYPPSYRPSYLSIYGLYGLKMVEKAERRQREGRVKAERRPREDREKAALDACERERKGGEKRDSLVHKAKRERESERVSWM